MRRFLPDRSRLPRFAALAMLSLVLFLAVYMISAKLGNASAQDANPSDSTALGDTERFVENVAFGPGEKFEFDINYGFINAGTASMSVLKLIDYIGRPAYQIATTANSNSFFSSIYRVEDRVESIMDAQGLYSWRFQKSLREGSYKADKAYWFDQLNHVVHYENDTIAVKPWVQDALSTMYYVRTQPFEVGKSFYLDNFVDGKAYKLEVRVLERERISVSAGTFDCIVVEPLTSTVGVFKNEGTLKVWLTDDKLRMPVLMKSKVLVGSISAELTDYTLGEIVEF